MTADKFDVFLSHNSGDESVVIELADALRRRGYSAWLDCEQTPPGALFQDEIQKGMSASEAAIVAYGEAGSGPWQDEEVRVLLQQSVKQGKRIIPVILPGAPPGLPEMPAILEQRNWLDLREGITWESVTELIWGITGKKPTADEPDPETRPPVATPIPKPPAFYAEPAYLGSHKFVGRRAELDRLDDWAARSDPHAMLLFEAIGGTGKSMLTWHWVNEHAAKIRSDWAGRFWYSFYEKGARLESFCRYALAYMSGQPVERFNKMKAPELGERLLANLSDRPWLVVFDGLERILVAYNRSDAAELSDEEVENPEDKIANRNPCAAIRPEDDELLTALSAAAPSKLLLTSRLIPRALLNTANAAIPGVLHERLHGLRPADAEALIRSDSCGNISGNSERIRAFVQEHCGCHPLVIGVLAGLINQPASWRGDFDVWERMPDGGGQLNLADLDLSQKRNHILESALAVLPEKSRALLSTLALLSEAADAELMRALNPHLPREPNVVREPPEPSDSAVSGLSEEKEKKAMLDYPAEIGNWEGDKRAVEERRQPQELRIAPQLLWKTVADLEARGLLQYDGTAKHYDLHPVVRGIVMGGLRPEETKVFGERVVDHFSARPHAPYDQADTLDDVHDGLQVVRTLLRMGRKQAACDALSGDLSGALLFNLQAHTELLALMENVFPDGWDRLPETLSTTTGAVFANDAAIALHEIGQHRDSLVVLSTSLRHALEHELWPALRARLSNIANNLPAQNRLASALRLRRLAFALAENIGSNVDIFNARFGLFASATVIGRRAEAETLWEELDRMGRNWHRSNYRGGSAEAWYARYRYWGEDLCGELLQAAERLAVQSRNRPCIAENHTLRGEWHLDRREYQRAIKSFGEVLRMDRESKSIHEGLHEARLLLARLRANGIDRRAAAAEALHLANHPRFENKAHRILALIWIELGDEHRGAATRHALEAYKWAWADGEPYVRRYELEKTKAILDQLGEPYPDLPPYDPEKDIKFDWEDDVKAAIEKLKAKRKSDKA